VFAQQPGSDYPAACDEAKVTRGDHERAHTVFLSGKQYLEESNYDKAISYFKDAYAIDCSVHAMLPIIATAYERKGDKAEAIRALGEYLRRAPNAPDHEVIEHRIHNLRDQLAREAPTTAPAPTPGPAPSASTLPAPTSGTPSALSPAPASGPGAAPPAATAAPTSSAPPPEPQPEAAQSPAPWILVGVGGAVVATGVGLFIIGSGKISSANSDCPNRMCPPSVVDSANKKQSDGYTLENVGGAVGGVGLAAAAAGLIWGLTRGPAAPRGGTTVSPVVTSGYGGVAVGGHF
jgi:tetratricopeptide (TPR) repeat protein